MNKEPAFPTEDDMQFYHGLTKREYFAAIALQGLLTHDHSHTSVIQQAVKLADMMIEELDKKLD